MGGLEPRSRAHCCLSWAPGPRLSPPHTPGSCVKRGRAGRPTRQNRPVLQVDRQPRPPHCRPPSESWQKETDGLPWKQRPPGHHSPVTALHGRVMLLGHCSGRWVCGDSPLLPLRRCWSQLREQNSCFKSRHMHRPPSECRSEKLWVSGPRTGTEHILGESVLEDSHSWLPAPRSSTQPVSCVLAVPPPTRASRTDRGKVQVRPCDSVVPGPWAPPHQPQDKWKPSSVPPGRPTGPSAPLAVSCSARCHGHTPLSFPVHGVPSSPPL